jgi:hypothetical protein
MYTCDKAIIFFDNDEESFWFTTPTIGLYCPFRHCCREEVPVYVVAHNLHAIIVIISDGTGIVAR